MDDKGVTFLSDLARERRVIDTCRPEDPRPLYLLVQNGGVPGALVMLHPGINRIGRSSDNSIQFNDETVSRFHAVIAHESEGAAKLTDLGSTNGTYLNGNRVEKQKPVKLRDGDRIQIGATVVVKIVRPDAADERFQRELFDRAVRDPLTRLYNRGYFYDQVFVLHTCAAKKQLVLALIMLDIDHFKSINDTYGHDTGDVVLREVAQTLRQSTRSEDLAARYGGEEFIVALPVSSADQATDRAERIRGDIEERTIRGPRGERIPVTASVGLVCAQPDQPTDVPSLIASADLCLYRAKKLGRNRVVLGRPSLSSFGGGTHTTFEI